MDLQEKINEIKDYFKEMQILTVDGKQIMYVIVSFPNGWVIESDLDKRYNITILKNEHDYVFCCDIADGTDSVFNAINHSINKMKDVIERANLLAEKTRELKGLFSDESIPVEQLKTLRFVYGLDDTLLNLPITDVYKQGEGLYTSAATDTVIETSNKKKEEKKVNE